MYAGAYRQLPLPYAYSALEPYIDAATMEIHYSRHHAAYTSNLNKAVEGQPWSSTPLFDLFMEIEKYPMAVRNNGGGYYNHLLFWQLMKPGGGGLPTGKLSKAIDETFGSFEKFQSEFNSNASSQFGSGWAWLSVNAEGKLFVSSTANQDNPLMSIAKNRGIPVLCIDVWEHAYYLKYQNKRTDYVKAFWSVINWDEVSRRYEEAIKAVRK
ncbi:MAG: superoxide dismutase [Bacteroidetes bacterium GWE2_42_24]|nr:MAG: superoxide dismutase [Bacteroidetes bacterium GWE2_42_24]OFY30643.1 MAG: superoxide dismutase [Bacteroidetes bacterium GWF2_43_11]